MRLSTILLLGIFVMVFVQSISEPAELRSWVRAHIPGASYAIGAPAPAMKPLEN